MQKIVSCPCCGNTEFDQQNILWKELVRTWKLSDAEEDYINRQQGLTCSSCHSNLRSMTLAAAIMRCYGFEGTLEAFVRKYSKRLSLLEINTAGHLNGFLSQLKHHTLADYPDVDIMKLPYKDASYDVIVHSDTLEHVPDPVKGLRETLRVLKPGGFTCYTVPMVVGRLSKRRDGQPASYHGTPGEVEYLVHTEFGADVWTGLMEAGFDECRLVTVDYPASVAIIGVKAK